MGQTLGRKDRRGIVVLILRVVKRWLADLGGYEVTKLQGTAWS